MKKIISILLVAMLIIGMFPATVFAADTTETLSIIANKGTVGTNTISWTQNGVTFTNNKGSSSTAIRTSDSDHYRVYQNSEVVITAPGNITKIVITATSSSYATAMKNSAGTGATVSSSTVTIVPTTSNATYTISKMTAQSRIKEVAVTYAASEPGEPECEHTNTTAIGEAADPTCTEAGITAGEKCADCGETVTAQAAIPALGHNYVDGACSVCGSEEPNTVDVTISFADATQRTSYSTSAQVWANGGVTFTNNKASSTTNVNNSTGPVRLYANSSLVFEAPGNIATIVVNCNTADYATALVNSIDSGATANGKVVTITPTTAATTYTVAKLSAQVRADSLIVTYAAVAVDQCDHKPVLKEEAVAATCTTPGKEAYYECACGETTQGGAEIAVLGHNMVEGVCSRCGLYEKQAEVMTAAPGNGDKIIIHHISSNSALGLAATSDDLVGIATTPTEGKLPYYSSVAVLTVGQVGDTYTFTNADGKYLSTADSNQLGFVAVADANSYWTIALTDEKFIITNAGTSTLALEYYNGAFTTYTAGTGDYYQMALYLVEKGEEACQHPTTEPIAAVEATCTSTGLTEGAKCTVCGVTTVPQTEVPMLDHNYVDDICTECGAKIPARYYIAATRTNGTAWYMTSDLGDKSTKRYQAVATDILPSNINPDQAVSAQVFILTDNGDGTCILQAEGIEGDNYLGWKEATGSAANNGALVAEENALKLQFDITEEGYYNIHFTATDEERYLSLNGSTGSEYFAWYKNTQVYNLALIPVEEAETTTATLYGDVDGIAVDGELTLDLNGKAATNVSATEIRAYDSTATATAEGTGTLTVAAGTVKIDNTVDGKRYIALENEGVYTFHVLEMKLSAVTLRTSNAGFYYNAKIVCDPTLAGAVDTYGVALSLDSMPDASVTTKTAVANEGETALESGVAFTSGSVSGIFKTDADNATRGQLSIYANAYIKIGETVILADTTVGDKVNDDGFNGIALSMKDVMESLDEKVYPALTAKDATEEQKAQKAVVDTFYSTWAAAMTGWLLPNIVAAAA